MYYEIKIESNTKEGLVAGIQECLENIDKEYFGAMRPTYAIQKHKRVSRKKTYWYVDWNNYMGSGSVKSVRLSRDEYLRLKGNGGNKELVQGLPHVWPYETYAEAETSLVQHYCD